jgi:hypothetical protein
VPPDHQRLETKSLPQVLGELKDLTVTYARQETIDPVRGLGRFVAYGVGGSFVLGVGLCLLGLAALRALQTETEAFDGFWSWVPYLITAVVLVALAFVAVLRIKRKEDDDDRR